MGTEKRKEIRINQDFSILVKTFRKIELEGAMFHIADISKTSVAFFTDNQLTPNDILQLTFRIPPDFKEKVDVYGRVVYSRLQTPKGYRTSLIFIDMDTKTKALLIRLVQESNLKKHP